MGAAEGRQRAPAAARHRHAARSDFPSHGPDFAEISATTKYARWHQEGTGPYVILPVKGKALSFTGAGGDKVVRRKVNHPGLPPRPFIGLSASDRKGLLDIASSYLEQAAEG